MVADISKYQFSDIWFVFLATQLMQGGEMNDDIVTRLRAEANRLRFVVNGTSLLVVSPSLQDEAANEIERLREELETYKDLYAAELVAKAVGHE